MDDKITLRVTRYRPDKDREPSWQDYDVPLRDEWTVLDALNHVKSDVDTTLAFRWSCRMGICGSCGMNVEGEPRLTCATFLSDYAPGPVRVEPLANFPVARDLVVDIELHLLLDLQRQLRQAAQAGLAAQARSSGRSGPRAADDRAVRRRRRGSRRAPPVRGQRTIELDRGLRAAVEPITAIS